MLVPVRASSICQIDLSENCISLEYLTPYNCVQANEYYKIVIITRNHIVVYKLLVLDTNTWLILFVFRKE